MLVYSTRFRVKPDFDEDKFFGSIIEWNSSGMYPVENIKGRTYPFKAGDDSRSIEIICLEDERIIAARSHIENDGGVWNSELILNCRSNILSVYVRRKVTENTLNTEPRAFMVSFVKQIIKKGFVEKSMGFEITDKALCDCDEELIKKLPLLADEYALPVVYLSSASEINYHKLAPKLTGLAVVVTDSNDLLKEQYPEPIYVFFPHKNKKPVSFGSFPFHRDIRYVVCDYLNSREYNKLETWDGVQNEIADRANIELLGKYKETVADNDTLMDMYRCLEEEMRANSEHRDSLSFENNCLIAENARLMQENERLRVNGTPLIMLGKEKDIYSGEQYEIIMEILAEYLAKLADKGSRRADILESVIEANPVKGIPKKKREIIKGVLDGYKAFETAEITRALKKTGIKIIEHTGHYKIALNGDHRYVCEAAATCSDRRGGQNLISEINRKMF